LNMAREYLQQAAAQGSEEAREALRDIWRNGHQASAWMSRFKLIFSCRRYLKTFDVNYI
jgi:hypothetical protein